MCKIFSKVLSKKPVTRENWEKIFNKYFGPEWYLKCAMKMFDITYILFCNLRFKLQQFIIQKNPPGNCPQTTANIFISRSSDFHKIWTILWPKLMEKITLVILLYPPNPHINRSLSLIYNFIWLYWLYVELNKINISKTNIDV